MTSAHSLTPANDAVRACCVYRSSRGGFTFVSVSLVFVGEGRRSGGSQICCYPSINQQDRRSF